MILPRLRYRLIDWYTDRNALGRYDELVQRIQRLPREELVRIQEEKLRALVRHAFDTTVYYRRLFDSLHLTPDDIRTAADLVKLPVLTKDVIRRHFEDFKSTGYDSYGPRMRATSGSTGQAFHYVLDRECHSWGHAYMLLAWHAAGFRLGEFFVQLSVSTSKTKGNMKQRVFELLRNSRDLSSFDLDPARMDEFVDLINHRRPTMLYGYSSALALLAKHIVDTGARVHPLTCVVTTGENLLIHNRMRIEQAFGCRVFDQYGVSEGGITAFECEHHNGYHLGMTTNLVEVLDDAGRPMLDQVGHIVSTSLDNHAFPMIRYDSGDIGSKTDRLCPCGRGFEMLASLEGRTREFLTTASGRKIHGAIFSYIVRDNPWINQYQIVQTQPGIITVRIMSDDAIDESRRHAIVDYFHRHCPDDPMTVVVEHVDDIPLMNNNKRHFVVSTIQNI